VDGSYATPRTYAREPLGRRGLGVSQGGGFPETPGNPASPEVPETPGNPAIPEPTSQEAEGGLLIRNGEAEGGLATTSGFSGPPVSPPLQGFWKLRPHGLALPEMPQPPDEWGYPRVPRVSGI